MKYLTLVIRVNEEMKKPQKITDAIEMLAGATVVASSWSDAISEKEHFKRLCEGVKNDKPL